jgi:very-short-patch-repair endonuclease
MPSRRTTPTGYEVARKLRKEPTPAETKLWAYLRGGKLNGVSFRRQHALSNFIVDFVSIKKKLVIELDGSQHLEQEQYDHERSKYLKSQGYKVIRFWNNQVMSDIDGVLRAIVFAMDVEAHP